MKQFKEFLAEAESDSKLVDDVVTALKKAGVKEPEVYNAGDNFNVAFESGDTEYYVRPNDKGEALFYIDADEDDFKEIKVSDTEALVKKVKELMK